jgi:nitroimidazol reductase NimA-like FMN-containing flavoprotein (pyridoxamine 5'-phosphate oxidase superfamily)
MDATSERTHVATGRARPLSGADKELRALKVYMKKITSSKKEAEGFLERAGIIDKKGELAKPYRP